MTAEEQKLTADRDSLGEPFRFTPSGSMDIDYVDAGDDRECSLIDIFFILSKPR